MQSALQHLSDSHILSCKVPAVHQEQFGVQYHAQRHMQLGGGFEPANFQLLDDLLYLLSYSHSLYFKTLSRIVVKDTI